jgi:cytoskeletal protein RodZ
MNAMMNMLQVVFIAIIILMIFVSVSGHFGHRENTPKPIKASNSNDKVSSRAVGATVRTATKKNVAQKQVDKYSDWRQLCPR